MTSIRWAMDDKKARRERIATQILAGFASNFTPFMDGHGPGEWGRARRAAVEHAVVWADELILELDAQDDDE